MIRKKLKLCAIFLFGLGMIGLQAQEIHEAIPATGGNASGSGGSVSYSVGQLVYTTNTGTTGSVAQGVQQPYEISVVTGIEEAKGINLMVSAYPNPTADYLTLKVDDYDNKNLLYQLYDLNGMLLESKKIKGNVTSIDMSNLVPATYFLKIVQTSNALSQQVTKTFKIIKN